jgi:hypothetical protein
MSELLHQLLGIINLQCLHVSGEPRDAHEAGIVDLEDSLKVGVNGHQLGRETGVSGDCNTVLACHGYHDVTVVVEDGLKELERVGGGRPTMIVFCF